MSVGQVAHSLTETGKPSVKGWASVTHDHLEDHDPEHHEDGSRDVDQGRPARDRFTYPLLVLAC